MPVWQRIKIQEVLPQKIVTLSRSSMTGGTEPVSLMQDNSSACRSVLQLIMTIALASLALVCCILVLEVARMTSDDRESILGQLKAVAKTCVCVKRRIEFRLPSNPLRSHRPRPFWKWIRRNRHLSRNQSATRPCEVGAVCAVLWQCRRRRLVSHYLLNSNRLIFLAPEAGA